MYIYIYIYIYIFLYIYKTGITFLNKTVPFIKSPFKKISDI